MPQQINRLNPNDQCVNLLTPCRFGTLKLLPLVALYLSLLIDPLPAQTISGDQANPTRTLSGLPMGMAETSPAEANDGTRNPLPVGSLGRDDLVELRVAYCPELSHSFRVASNGILTLPILHQEIQVAGLTAGQAAARIRQALIDERIMPDPVVNVSVLEVRSRPVSVVGAVVHPLTFQVSSDVTLLDAIAMAGGFTPGGASMILISSRHQRPDATVAVSVQEIPVRGLLLHANAASNVLLHGGEEIRVTEAGKVFVAGNVVKPGAYTMQADEDTTVLKALALSSGLQRYSTHTAYIYRLSASGDRKEIAVPLSRIMARKNPDISLVADDILYIPENNGKRMTAHVLAQVAGFGQTTAAGILIYR